MAVNVVPAVAVVAVARLAAALVGMRSRIFGLVVGAGVGDHQGCAGVAGVDIEVMPGSAR